MAIFSDFSFKKCQELFERYHSEVEENVDKWTAELQKMPKDPIIQELETFLHDVSSKEVDRKKIKLNLNKFTKKYEEIQTAWGAIRNCVKEMLGPICDGMGNKSCQDGVRICE